MEVAKWSLKRRPDHDSLGPKVDDEEGYAPTRVDVSPQVATVREEPFGPRTRLRAQGFSHREAHLECKGAPPGEKGLPRRQVNDQLLLLLLLPVRRTNETSQLELEFCVLDEVARLRLVSETA